MACTVPVSLLRELEEALQEWPHDLVLLMCDYASLRIEAYLVEPEDQLLVEAWLTEWLVTPFCVRFLDEPSYCQDDHLHDSVGCRARFDKDAMLTNSVRGTDVFAWSRTDNWGWWLSLDDKADKQYSMVIRFPAVDWAWHKIEKDIRQFHCVTRGPVPQADHEWRRQELAKRDWFFQRRRVRTDVRTDVPADVVAASDPC